MEREYIYIFKGDDTNWNNERFVTVNVTAQAGVDLSGMTAKFMLGSYTKEYPLTTGSFKIDLSAAITGQYAFGPICGTIQILDSEKRIKTACNTIPFYITDKVIADQHQTLDIDLPQGSPVSINLSVGGTVSYNDLTDKPSLNGATIEGAKTSSQYGLANTRDIVALQEQIDGKQPAGEYATQADLSQGLATKQNTLNAEGQQAVASGINAAKVASYDGHLLNTSNPHSVTKAQVGLGNADNTSDLAKPISTATQAALDGKQNTLTAAQQAAVDSGVTSSTVAQVQTNKENIAALDEELDENREWQKPADWVDIRSGAINNSVYALVAHSAPVESEGTYTISNYSVFGFYVTVSNNGTYDVFVDGNKVATSANASSTVIDFAQLYNNGTLVGGSDVTYPAALTTHIVRITPTLDTNNITGIQQAAFESSTNTGILWVHFTTKSALHLRYFIQGNNGKGYAPLLEAITSSGNALLVSNIADFGSRAVNLRELPWFDGGGAVVNASYFCQGDQLIKTFKFKNMTITGVGLCRGNAGLEKILYENVTFALTAYDTYNGCRKLTSIPANFSSLYSDRMDAEVFRNATNLQIPLLELSKFSSCKRILLGGTSSSKLYGIKGLTVSNEAPFTGASPQINVSYTGIDRAALVNLFRSMPTVSAGQVCNITGATGAADLTAEDLAIATEKGWTITR